MEDSARIEDRKAAARRTLTALLITVSALFVGSILFMVVRGDQNAPEGRRVLAVLPVQGPNSEAGPGRYAGFGEGLAAYFGRADPMDLGVFGPASTSRLFEFGDDPLAVGRTLGADIVLVGREVSGASLLRSWWSCSVSMMAPPSGEASSRSAPIWTEARCCSRWQ